MIPNRTRIRRLDKLIKTPLPISFFREFEKIVSEMHFRGFLPGVIHFAYFILNDSPLNHNVLTCIWGRVIQHSSK